MVDLIVVGTRRDPHVDRVVVKVTEAGHSCIVLDVNEKLDLVVRQNVDGGIGIRINGHDVSGNSIFWSRCKLYFGSPLYFGDAAFDTSDVDVAPIYFRMGEWLSLFKILCTVFSSQTINNQYSASIKGKILQQQLANEVGMQTPPSIITTVRAEALDFVLAHGDSVMKSISGVRVNPGRKGIKNYGVMTTPVSFQEINVALDSQIRSCPHFFQKEIKKLYELRVVYVDGGVLAFRINSQDKEYTKVDWRYGNHVLDFTQTTIPRELEKKVVRFMRRYDLCFGSLDFIVDLKNEYWFLECNSEGAWAWLDDVCEGEISEKIANVLIRRIMNQENPENTAGPLQILDKLSYSF